MAIVAIAIVVIAMVVSANMAIAIVEYNVQCVGFLSNLLQRQECCTNASLWDP